MNAARGSTSAASWVAIWRKVPDVGLSGKRDVWRLEIRAFHQPDGRSQRQERLEVFLRAMQVRLNRDTDGRGTLARALEQVERAIDIRRALHVDPHEAAALTGPLDQAQKILKTALRIEIQPQLRRLHRNLGVEAGLPDPVQRFEVMTGDVGGLVCARHVLAQLREHRADAKLPQADRRFERVFQALAGHECRDRPPHEGGPRGAFAQPSVGRCREKDPPGNRHLHDRLDEAAVYLKGRTRDVRRGVRQQECGDAAELLGRAISSERNRGGRARTLRLEADAGLPGLDLVKLPQPVGVDTAWNHLIHANAIGRELERQGLGQGSAPSPTMRCS
jgi:hypothetical protein